MSYDLAVWHSTKILGCEAAAKAYRSIRDRGSAKGLEPSRRLEKFLTRLRKTYPWDEGEGGAWSDEPRSADAFAILHVLSSAADEVVPAVLLLAEEHGLSAYDPQEEYLQLPVALRKKASKKEGPRPRERFDAACREIAKRLGPLGFVYAEGLAPHAARPAGPLTEVVSFNLSRFEDRSEFNLRMAVVSKTLGEWRGEQARRDPRLPLQRGADVASMDFRRLDPPHELFSWDVTPPHAWSKLVDAAAKLVREQGIPWAETFRDPLRILERFERGRIPGLGVVDLVEHLLSLGHPELARRALDAHLLRRPQLRGPWEASVAALRSGRPAREGPREARDLALAVVLYGL